MTSIFPDKFRSLNESLVDDWSGFEAAHADPSPASIRINPKKINKKPQLTQIPWCQNGYYLPERPNYTLDPLFHAGAYYVQEPGSMLLSSVLQRLEIDKTEAKVLDLCAAPGGKSTLLLDWLDGNGLLVSNEVIGKRARVLEENLAKWGHANRIVSNSDPKQFARCGEIFDVVVVDAPCSGEGMFRKEQDAREMWNPELVEHCHLRQCRILAEAWDCLKPGGYLVYSTCTYNTRENESSILELINGKGGESVPMNFEKDWSITESQNLGVHGYRCFPHKLKSEGFFISVLQKNGSTVEPAHKRKNKFSLANKEAVNAIKPWLLNPEQFTATVHRDNVHFFPKEIESTIDELTRQIHVLSVGQQAGKIIRGELIPDTNLALSVSLNTNHIPTLELTVDDSLNYLRKMTIRIEDQEDGLYCITHRQVPFDISKIVSGALKSKWPKGWRILQTGNGINVLDRKASV